MKRNVSLELESTYKKIIELMSYQDKLLKYCKPTDELSELLSHFSKNISKHIKKINKLIME